GLLQSGFHFFSDNMLPKSRNKVFQSAGNDYAIRPQRSELHGVAEIISPKPGISRNYHDIIDSGFHMTDSQAFGMGFKKIIGFDELIKYSGVQAQQHSGRSLFVLKSKKSFRSGKKLDTRNAFPDQGVKFFPIGFKIHAPI